LPEVLGSPQQGAAGADPVACRQRCLALLGQVRREAGPGPVPAIAVTGSDLPGDGQALAHVGHARIGLADTALELAVEILVIEIQLHDVSPVVHVTVVRLSAARHG
jgi:hypothetical protein